MEIGKCSQHFLTFCSTKTAKSSRLTKKVAYWVLKVLETRGSLLPPALPPKNLVARRQELTSGACLTHFRYLSTLYSHPEWPTVHPRIIRQDLRENVKDNWMWLLLTPSWLYHHMSIILRKKSQGQPVSFTDFFGYLVGETILKDVSLPEPRSHSREKKTCLQTDSVLNLRNVSCTSTVY